MGDLPARDEPKRALLNAVRRAAEALAALVPYAVTFGDDVVTAIETACEDVEPSLGKTEVTIAVVGDAPARRALLRAVLGDVVGATVRGSAERTTRVRATQTYDYSARFRDGNVVRFARAMPDRDPLFAKSLERAEAEERSALDEREKLAATVEAARAEVREIEDDIPRIAEAIEKAGQQFAEAWRAEREAKADVARIEKQTPQVPARLTTPPPWWAPWFWIARWLLARRWREPLRLLAANQAQLANARRKATERAAAMHAADADRESLKAQHQDAQARLEQALANLATLEVQLAEENNFQKCHAHVEQLIRERQKYAGERKDEFLADLRAFDETARGDELEELLVEYPTTCLPEGLVLIDSKDLPDDADGFVLVRETTGTEPAAAADVRTRLPQVLSVSTQAGRTVQDVSPLLDRVGQSRHLIVAARIAMKLRACIARISKERQAAEEAHLGRLAALESQRIPDPTAFRARQLDRSNMAIEQGADDVVRMALERLETDIDALGSEWRKKMNAASGKKAIAECASDVDTTSAARIDDVLEATSELIAREMQSVTESLERWALDEIRNRYHTAPRMRAESLAPVASDVTREDLAERIFGLFPTRGAVEAFERKRRRFGIAGVGAGAVIGTVIKPGLGTLAGAVIGALAALLERPERLRRDCLARLDAYVGDVRTRIATQLAAKRDDLARGIRFALDQALEQSLVRINDSVTRLMNVEKQAIQSEREQLAQLLSTRGTLEEHDAALSKVLDAVRF